MVLRGGHKYSVRILKEFWEHHTNVCYFRIWSVLNKGCWQRAGTEQCLFSFLSAGSVWLPIMTYSTNSQQATNGKQKSNTASLCLAVTYYLMDWLSCSLLPLHSNCLVTKTAFGPFPSTYDVRSPLHCHMKSLPRYWSLLRCCTSPITTPLRSPSSPECGCVLLSCLFISSPIVSCLNLFRALAGELRQIGEKTNFPSFIIHTFNNIIILNNTVNGD